MLVVRLLPIELLVSAAHPWMDGTWQPVDIVRGASDGKWPGLEREVG